MAGMQGNCMMCGGVVSWIAVILAVTALIAVTTYIIKRN